MDEENIKILLIEDDKQLAQTITNLFKKYYDIEVVGNINDALIVINKKVFDLFLVDIMLPGGYGKSGLDICKEIRKYDDQTPILIITAKKAINFKLGAFNIGADDYLCKPFNYLELKARIDTLLKRSGGQPAGVMRNPLKVADLILEKTTHNVIRNGKNINLRKKEFELLEYFIKNAGLIVTREMLLDNLWESGNNVRSNTVDVHVRNLRDKIDKPFETKLIKTVYGVGYKLEP